MCVVDKFLYLKANAQTLMQTLNQPKHIQDYDVGPILIMIKACPNSFAAVLQYVARVYESMSVCSVMFSE